MESVHNVKRLKVKLKARIQVLTKRRDKEMRAYDASFESWRKELASWLRSDEAKQAALKILKGDVEGNSWRDRGWTSALLESAPRPPQRPSYKVIEKARKYLRHLEIMEQRTVQLYSSDVDELFSDEEDEE